MSNFLGMRSQVGPYETGLVYLLRNRNTLVPSSLSRDPSDNDTRFPVPVFAGKRSDLGDSVKLFDIRGSFSLGC